MGPPPSPFTPGRGDTRPAALIPCGRLPDPPLTGVGLTWVLAMGHQHKRWPQDTDPPQGSWHRVTHRSKEPGWSLPMGSVIPVTHITRQLAAACKDRAPSFSPERGR